MTARLSRTAPRQIEAILLDSGARFGEETAARCKDLILAVTAAIGREPHMPAASAVPGQPFIRAYHLRLGRKLAPVTHRVGRPRHIVPCRVLRRDDVLILGLVHERMLLERAAAELARHSAEG